MVADYLVKSVSGVALHQRIVAMISIVEIVVVRRMIVIMDIKNNKMEATMKASEKLISVLCDQSGSVCITGSNEDNKILADAIGEVMLMEKESKKEKYFTVGILANTYQSMESKNISFMKDKIEKEFKGDGAVYLDFKADNMVYDIECDLIKLIKFNEGASVADTVAYFNSDNIIGIWEREIL